MVPVTPQPTRATTDAFYPLILNSGRIRDQWHTMTRTGAVPRLMQHIAEPMVEVAPQDAVRYQLPADGLARIWSRHGVMVAKVAISEGQRPGSLFVPMHWNNQFARQGRVNNLLAAVTDPYSGQPESKQAAVAIAAPATGPGTASFFAANRYHFLRPRHWRRRATPGVLHYSLAGEASARQWLSAWCARRGWQLQVADGGAVWNLLAPASGKADARLVERCARAGGGLRMDKRCLCRAAVRCCPTTCLA